MLISFASGFDQRTRTAVHLIVIRVHRAPEIRSLQSQYHVRVGHHGVASRGLVQRMARGEIHPVVHVDHRSLQRFGQLDEPIDSGLRARVAAHHDHRIFRLRQHPRRFRHRAGFAHRRRGQSQFRNAQPGVCADRVFLQFAIGHQQHRSHRRRHGDFVSAHRGFGKMLQRSGLVVPFRVIADHRGGVLHAVRPLAVSGIARERVQIVGDDDIHRHAIAKRVVDGHRSMLQANRAVRKNAQRLALDLGIAMSHGHRRLFVTAGDELGILVAGVVDHRFVQPSETRTRHRANVLEVERLEDVHHEVGTGAVDGKHFAGCRRRIALHGREGECARRRGRCRRRGLRGQRACTRKGAGSRRYSLKELSPSDGSLFPSRHVFLPRRCHPEGQPQPKPCFGAKRSAARGICFFFSAFPGIV